MRFSNIIVALAFAVGLAHGEPSNMNEDTPSSSMNEDTPSSSMNEDAPGGGLRGSRKLSYYSWPSYYYGYGKARREWENGGYSCTSDGADEFESYVTNYIMYGRCSDQYEHNYDNRSACRDGARDIVQDKKEECFASVSECEGIGEATSDGIIAMHCELSMASDFAFKKKTWPQDCKNIGINECKNKVGKKSTYSDYHSSCSRPSGSLLENLKDLCKDEVNQYLS